MSRPVLEFDRLSVYFARRGGTIRVIRDVSFSVEAGKTLAIVGESGSGKSVTCLAAMGLTPPPPRCRIEGSVHFRQPDGQAINLINLAAPQMRRIRGDRIAMIFQEPMTSLNPLKKIGAQVMEGPMLHNRLSRTAARSQALELLDLVGIPDPLHRLEDYPHQLSGGMRQRVMIAIALGCSPDVLIADEPTTALDVTIQAQVLQLLRDLQKKTGMAIIFITHNMGVVAEMADDVMVMYSGQVVECSDVDTLFVQPGMPYSKGLLESIPDPARILDKNARLVAIPGSVPEGVGDIAACTFAPRCRYSADICLGQAPPFQEPEPGHFTRCHFAERFVKEGWSNDIKP